MDARVGPRVNGEEGVLREGKTGWRFCSPPPPCHGTIVGAEELLVMEFINSVHDRLSWGGHNIVQFCMFHSQKMTVQGFILNQQQRDVSGSVCVSAACLSQLRR